MQVGDVVKLKSGGPDMTISHSAELKGQRHLGWRGVWITDGGEVEEATFDERMLDMVKAMPQEKGKVIRGFGKEKKAEKTDD